MTITEDISLLPISWKKLPKSLPIAGLSKVEMNTVLQEGRDIGSNSCHSGSQWSVHYVNTENVYIILISMCESIRCNPFCDYQKKEKQRAEIPIRNSSIPQGESAAAVPGVWTGRVRSPNNLSGALQTFTLSISTHSVQI